MVCLRPGPATGRSAHPCTGWAEYAIEWIDKLTAMAEAAPGWRSQWEKDHVFAQFQEARAM